MIQRLWLGLIPLSLTLHAIEADPRVVFLLSLYAIVPLVEIMGIATERLANRLGSVVGGLINSTLSNAPELIIGIVALRNGLGRVVKASLTGSIMVNLLVGLDVLLLLVDWYGVHSFDRRQLRSSGLMLVMCGFCFIVPAVFRIGTPRGPESLDRIVIYSAGNLCRNVSINIFYSCRKAQDATMSCQRQKTHIQREEVLRFLGSVE